MHKMHKHLASLAVRFFRKNPNEPKLRRHLLKLLEENLDLSPIQAEDGLVLLIANQVICESMHMHRDADGQEVMSEPAVEPGPEIGSCTRSPVVTH